MQKLFRGPVVAAHSEDLTHFLEESPECFGGDNNIFGRARTPVTPRMLHIARDVSEVACLDYLPLQPVFGLYKLFSLTREQVEVIGFVMAVQRNVFTRLQGSLYHPIG